jgi:hypothetical protein
MFGVLHFGADIVLSHPLLCKGWGTQAPGLTSALSDDALRVKLQ